MLYEKEIFFSIPNINTNRRTSSILRTFCYISVPFSIGPPLSCEIARRSVVKRLTKTRITRTSVSTKTVFPTRLTLCTHRTQQNVVGIHLLLVDAFYYPCVSSIYYAFNDIRCRRIHALCSRTPKVRLKEIVSTFSTCCSFDFMSNTVAVAALSDYLFRRRWFIAPSRARYCSFVGVQILGRASHENVLSRSTFSDVIDVLKNAETHFFLFF